MSAPLRGAGSEPASAGEGFGVSVGALGSPTDGPGVAGVYDPKAIRTILSIRKKKKEEYQEEESILQVYMQALGMI
ncbi:GapR family DNA-binding domain-containing protein [Sphingomonas aerophila]|uniref:GapR-like DNA-binding domain-containing protein n=1 Tax=Sphingomonas aerophila TaxID=1344948 RepID=A0A7W9BDW4_9SPHN|nr:hypothetical protein [Sphingomonas aerophila]